MYRLICLSVALILTIWGGPYNPDHLGLAIVVGVAIVIYDQFRWNGEALTLRIGLLFLVFGSLCLAIAIFTSISYEMTFVEFVVDRTLPKISRRLPYYGIFLITVGALVVIKPIFFKNDR